MKRFYQFLNVVILISFISCQQFEINDLTIKKLDNQEINQFAITKELVKKKSKEQYDILYSKENIEYKRKMKFPEKKISRFFNIKDYIEEDKYKLPIQQFEKKFPNLLANLYLLNEINENKVKKYGIVYSFSYKNNYDEPIEKTDFITIVSYEFRNKKVNFYDNFTIEKIMKSNQSEEIKRNIVFNYQENYDSSYFTTYKPEKVILTVIAKSSNKVGYTKRTELKGYI